MCSTKSRDSSRKLCHWKMTDCTGSQIGFERVYWRTSHRNFLQTQLKTRWDTAFGRRLLPLRVVPIMSFALLDKMLPRWRNRVTKWVFLMPKKHQTRSEQWVYYRECWRVDETGRKELCLGLGQFFLWVWKPSHLGGLGSTKALNV